MSGCNVGIFFFKQKTAYEMRISDWSSDVCSSDLVVRVGDLADPNAHVVTLAHEIDQAVGEIERQLEVRIAREKRRRVRGDMASAERDRKSVVEGKSVSVRVDIGGRGSSEKKQYKTKQHNKQDHKRQTITQK